MKTVFENQGSLQLSEAREKISALQLRAERILEAGKSLDATFKKMFRGGRPALRFVRYRDRSLVIYRWRSFGRGSRPMDLTTGEGKKILLEQPQAVQKTWLEFEEQRQWLNLEYGLVEYQRRKLKDWIEQHERLQQLRQECFQTKEE